MGVEQWAWVLTMLWLTRASGCWGGVVGEESCEWQEERGWNHVARLSYEVVLVLVVLWWWAMSLVVYGVYSLCVWNSRLNASELRRRREARETAAAEAEPRTEMTQSLLLSSAGLLRLTYAPDLPPTKAKDPGVKELIGDQPPPPPVPTPASKNSIPIQASSKSASPSSKPVPQIVAKPTKSTGPSLTSPSNSTESSHLLVFRLVLPASTAFKVALPCLPSPSFLCPCPFATRPKSSDPFSVSLDAEIEVRGWSGKVSKALDGSVLIRKLHECVERERSVASSLPEGEGAVEVYEVEVVEGSHWQMVVQVLHGSPGSVAEAEEDDGQRPLGRLNQGGGGRSVAAHLSVGEDEEDVVERLQGVADSVDGDTDERGEAGGAAENGVSRRVQILRLHLGEPAARLTVGCEGKYGAGRGCECLRIRRP